MLGIIFVSTLTVIVVDISVHLYKYVKRRMTKVSNQSVVSMTKEQFENAWNNKLFLDDTIGSSILSKIKKFIITKLDSDYNNYLEDNYYNMPHILERQGNSSYEKDLYDNRKKLMCLTMKQHWEDTRCYKKMLEYLKNVFDKIKDPYLKYDNLLNNDNKNMSFLEIINLSNEYVNSDTHFKYPDGKLEIIFKNNLQELFELFLKKDLDRQCSTSFREIHDKICLFYFLIKIIVLGLNDNIQNYFMNDGKCTLFPTHFDKIDESLPIPKNYKNLLLETFDCWSCSYPIKFKRHLAFLSSASHLEKTKETVLIPLSLAVRHKQIHLILSKTIGEYFLKKDKINEFNDSIEKIVFFRK
jgi:hypothetical protein